MIGFAFHIASFCPVGVQCVVAPDLVQGQCDTDSLFCHCWEILQELVKIAKPDRLLEHLITWLDVRSWIKGTWWIGKHRWSSRRENHSNCIQCSHAEMPAEKEYFDLLFLEVSS
eukprot:scaffold16796_cov70-Attheya_sp.AAC.4